MRLSAAIVMVLALLANFGAANVADIYGPANVEPLWQNDPGESAGLGSELGREVFESTWMIYTDATWNAESWGYSYDKGGTGVGYREDGWIITNHHVVEGAESITVTGPDGVARAADKWFADQKTDVAVIHIPDVSLHVPKMGARNHLQLGDEVVIFGHPSGFPRTMTSGIVSGLHRSYFPNGGRNTPVMDFIQTDALGHPGNSGGGLYTADGTLVGIYKAGTSTVDGRSGIGFAITVDDARFVADRLIKEGAIAHGWLAIGMRNALDIPLETRNEYGIEGNYGVVITSTLVQSGETVLQPGDWIPTFAGEVLVNWTQFEMLLSRHQPDDSIALTVIRRGERLQVEVVLDELE